MFKYDLHLHTSESSACGNNTVGEMMKKLKSEGFSGAVLTNHFFFGNTCINRNQPWAQFVSEYCRPYYEAQKEAAQLDFDLLFGLEENYGGGKEFLVYGITPEFLAERPQLLLWNNTDSPYCTERLKLWYDEVKAAGGVLVLAHPFRERGYISDTYWLPDLSLCDGVELYNFCNTHDDNARAQVFASRSDMILTAGSDLHTVNFKGGAGIKVESRIRDEKALAEVLKSQNFERF